MDRLDQVEIVVEPREGLANESTADATQALARHVKSLIGISCRVRVEANGTIARSAGKAKRVLDFRTPP